MKKQNYYITKKTDHIIVFLISLIYAICPEARWTHSQCSDYLNSLNFSCDKIIKNEKGNEICENLKYPDINAPKECFNKIYTLPVTINNSDKPIKRHIVLYMKYNDKSKELNKNEEILDLNKKVEECLKNFIKYSQKCLNEKYYENEEYCKELEKIKDLNFCKSTVDEIAKKLRDKIQFELKDEFSMDFGGVNFQFDNDNNYYPFEIDYEDFEKKVEDKDCIGSNKNEEHENELDEYNNNSGKDCVEYGLTSLKDNIIVCTKYE